MESPKTRPIAYAIAIFAILGGVAFFIIQSSKLLTPGSSEIEMATQPLGLYEWGYVWSDTLAAGPSLLSGGIFMLVRKRAIRRIGQLLVFTGFAINLYAMIGLWVGLDAIGEPMLGTELWLNIFLTLLGCLSMVYLGVQIARD